MTQYRKQVTPLWDAVDVWRRLRRSNPVRVDDPARSIGRMDPRQARLFRISIADYPDLLQDALYVIAHARGFDAAIAALDQAIRSHLRDRVLCPSAGRDAPADDDAESWLRRAAS